MAHITQRLLDEAQSFRLEACGNLEKRQRDTAKCAPDARKMCPMRAIVAAGERQAAGKAYGERRGRRTTGASATANITTTHPVAADQPPRSNTTPPTQPPRLLPA